MSLIFRVQFQVQGVPVARNPSSLRRVADSRPVCSSDRGRAATSRRRRQHLPQAAGGVVTVTPTDVPYVGEFVGETESSQEVEIRARVEGFLESHRLPRGRGRQQGRRAVPDGSQALRGGARGGAGRAAGAAGTARHGERQPEARRAARRRGRAEPEGPRRRAGLRATRRSRPSRARNPAYSRPRST